MKTHLGNYVREQRTARGLTLGQLAKEVGYRNVGKGVNRLRALEESGTAHRKLLDAVVRALRLDARIVEELTLADRDEREREWSQWANEPIRPYVVEKIIPGVYRDLKIPDEHLDDPQGFAQRHAEQNRRRVCFVASRRLSVWIGEDGIVEGETAAQPDVPNRPYMTV
ncbi:MAG: hypothetical protein M0R80_24970 [Proteobacteria bacterium]|jgi:transcriptional regulator with XRE-family HTH domain|nr:hypothetical protein [Pseudomonadota bacterium]